MIVTLGPLPSLGKIDADQDFRCLPSLDEIDYVLPKAYRKGKQGQDVRKSQAGNISIDTGEKFGKGCDKRWKEGEPESERLIIPFHEIKGKVEELVAGADEEEKCLF